MFSLSLALYMYVDMNMDMYIFHVCSYKYRTIL